MSEEAGERCVEAGCDEPLQRSALRSPNARRVLFSLALGQVVSLCASGTSVTSELLNSQFAVHTPAAQSFSCYACLALVYGAALRCGRQSYWAALRARGWRYALLALVDVEANYLVVAAFRYTNLTSVSILNAFSTPCVLLLSWLFLKVRYQWWHKAAVAICQLGLIIVVYADYLTKPDASTGGSNRLLGDTICMTGVLLYAVSNVSEEHLVKSYSRAEFLAMLGAFGTVVSGVQTCVLERHQLLAVQWADYRIVLVYVGFALCLFAFYSLVSTLMVHTSALVFTLTMLSANLYTLLFGLLVFHYKFHYVYFIGYTLVIVGVVMYLLRDTHAAAKRPDDASGQYGTYAERATQDGLEGQGVAPAAVVSDD